ncbi:Single-stranded DNA-binding protein [Nymphaea thermarum]|nr:Single-stranded DNA-binding protein [Nymphaea thermarum]
MTCFPEAKHQGKAALTVEPRAPEFASLDSGAFKLSREGSVILQFAPAIGVSNKLQNVDENIYIPITKAEFTVLISACNFILPYLMGWQAFAETISPEDSVRWTNSQQQPAADLEWNR